MIPHQWRSSISVKLEGFVRFNDAAFGSGPMPNPTRSLLLGDPTGGGLCWGCELYVIDVEQLVGGLSGPVRLELWYDDADPPEGDVPIWYGRIIGTAIDLRRRPAAAEPFGRP